MRNGIPIPCVFLLALVLAWIAGPLSAEEHRLVTQGSINGRPARLVLDTGVSFPLAMPSRAMARFGLELDGGRSLDPSAAEILAGFSKPTRIALPPAFVTEDAVFVFLKDAPETLEWDFDAIIGWPGMSGNQLHYSRRKAITLSGRDLRLRIADWTAFPMLDSNVLVFDAGDAGRPIPVLVDTGWSGGVQLAPEHWNALLARNGDRAHTLASHFSPAFGLVVMKQLLVRRLEIGKAVFRNVLVSEAPPSQARGSIEPQVVLGLAAFANHELLVDGPARRVHIAPPDAAAVVPNYNRLGATFLPGTMAATVAARSPAASADVRDGDVLVAIDGLAPGEYAAKLTTHSVWEQPAGTALTLTLERAGGRITRRVVLQNFLDLPTD